jgi:hypothetical protein
MDLRCEDACGFCAENPEHIMAIFEDELELHQGFAALPFEPLAQA